MHENCAVSAERTAADLCADLRMAVSTIRVDMWSQTRPRADMEHVNDHHESQRGTVLAAVNAAPRVRVITRALCVGR